MKKGVIVLISLVLIGSIGNLQAFPTFQAETLLTIYTYDSLLADPGFDFIQAFADHEGISKDSIQLVRLSDANSILSRAALEKDNPVADVLIGLDNILIHQAKEEDILQPYQSPELVNISSDLITNLDPDYYLLPYDYGIIALWYDSNRINESTVSNINSLTLDDILHLDLDKQLIVEDPTLSSPGLGFLLWTIAVYGDPEINFQGLLGENWRDWWSEASSDLRITKSWGEALDLWFEPAEGRPIMISYGTSPAYGACLYNDSSAIAVLTHEQSKSNAWLQIEGIGLVKNAPHPDLAKKFIDWFLSTDLQDNIATNNWMYPANVHASIPECFANSAIDPSTVNILNSLISSDMLSENLDMWLQDWQDAVAAKGVSFPSLLVTLVSLLVVTPIVVHFGKRKKNL